jgi:hypothetical protein
MPASIGTPVNAEIGFWSEADADALLAIYGRIFGKEKTAAKRSAWAWQYEQNPRAPQGPVVWVARANGRPFGQMGSIPVALWWGGREVRASWGIDYFVAPDAEGLGHSIALARAWLESVDVALALGLAHTSYLICKRLGFRDLGHVPFFEAVLDPAAVARRRWGRLAGAAAAPLSSGLRYLARRRRTRLLTDVEVTPAGEIGAEYDELWERVRAGFAACVRRDTAYVRWKYRCAPNKEYTILEARRAGQLTGFAVSRCEEYRGLRLGWIVDLFAAPNDQPTRKALLTSLMGAFAEARVARVQIFCTHARLHADLRRHGFFRSVSRARLCVRPNGVSDGPIAQSDDWHVVFGDSDSDR